MFIQFLKKIIGSVIILLFSIVYSTAEIVKSIIIEGNERVNSETIKIFGEVSINDNLNSEDVNLNEFLRPRFIWKLVRDSFQSVLLVFGFELLHKQAVKQIGARKFIQITVIFSIYALESDNCPQNDSISLAPI